MVRVTVSGRWLTACGFGGEDQSFPLVRVMRRALPNGLLMFVVDRNGQEWPVLESRLVGIEDQQLPALLVDSVADLGERWSTWLDTDAMHGQRR